jgi:hypothetical protein
MTPDPAKPVSRAQAQTVATSFLALFSISGLGFYGLSFFFELFIGSLLPQPATPAGVSGARKAR